MVAAVIEHERRAAVTLVEAGNLQRTAERERVALLEVAGLLRRLTRERIRTRVEHGAGDRVGELSADLLLARAAGKAGTAAALKSAPAWAAVTARTESTAAEVPPASAEIAAASARTELTERPIAGRTERIAAAGEAIAEQRVVQLPGAADARDRFGRHVGRETRRQEQLFASLRRRALTLAREGRLVRDEREALEAVSRARRPRPRCVRDDGRSSRRRRRGRWRRYGCARRQDHRQIEPRPAVGRLQRDVTLDGRECRQLDADAVGAGTAETELICPLGRRR